MMTIIMSFIELKSCLEASQFSPSCTANYFQFHVLVMPHLEVVMVSGSLHNSQVFSGYNKAQEEAIISKYVAERLTFVT